jgi:selenide,water dikinase
MVNHPREKAGVFAVRQGPALAVNLRRIISGQKPKPFKPQTRFLGLISTGDKYAVASWGWFSFAGRWVWHWKDRIDRKFMELYSSLEPMKADLPLVKPAVAEGHETIDPMRCSGCAAKVGGTVLSRVMNRLQTEYSGVFSSGELDDAAVLTVPSGNKLIQSVDFFRGFISDPYVLGRVAANHCLNDIFSMGAVPHSALAIVASKPASHVHQEDFIYGMLSGALEEFQNLGVKLIGGHTAEFSETGLGFTINGFAPEDQIMHKTGLEIGDELILTKPLGTGVLLAGQMRLLTKGRWIESALHTMMFSNADAATIFRDHGVKACTDVTGFGLIGHMLEMIGDRDNIAISLRIDQVPVLEGVHQVQAAGVESSLAVENINYMTSVDLKVQKDHEGLPVMFDPQTAGGLLAAVPADKVSEVIGALHEKGYTSAVSLGTVVDRDLNQKPVIVT